MAESQARFDEALADGAARRQRRALPPGGLAGSKQHTDRQHQLARIAIVAAWLLGAIVLAVMAVAAHSTPRFPGDAGFSAWLQQWRHTLVAVVVDFPGVAQTPVPGAIVGFGVLAILAVMRRFLALICTAVASFGGDGINVSINRLVARPRPPGASVQTIGTLGKYAFPSGHVTHVVGLFGFLLFLTILAQRARPDLRWLLLPLQAICVYFIAFVGLGRIMEGDHQPSDVLAGYILGAMMLTVAIGLYHRLGAWWQRRKERQASQRA
jgi:membrane-associated phospholipid phosphatase